MTVGADSAVVNGQLVGLPPMSAYAPQGYGPQTIGVPQVSPSYPPYMGAPLQAAAPGSEAVGGYGTAGNNAAVAAIANAHPWHWKVSPVPWAVAGLVLSLVALKTVHWRETIIEGKEALDFGPVHERGEAGA